MGKKTRGEVVIWQSYKEKYGYKWYAVSNIDGACMGTILLSPAWNGYAEIA
jgi:hypothetical protein